VYTSESLLLATVLAGCSGTLGAPITITDDVSTTDGGTSRFDGALGTDRVTLFDDAQILDDRPTQDVTASVDPCAQLADGAWCAGLLGLPSGGLLRCAGGRSQGIDPCPDGCIDREAATDACASDAVEPCFNDPDGSYCGASIGASVRRDDVYICAGHRTARIEACPAGCDDRAGATDACRPADPCARAMSGNGAYCGAGISGDANVLYDCQGGHTASQTRCPMGCDPQPPGVADRCVQSDPCARATSGNGAYCGGGIGGDGAVLYDCQGGHTASQTRCPLGCAAQPPGVPDRCLAAGRCCIQRPPGGFVRGFSACGHGGSHYGIDYSNGLGTPLASGIAGTVVSVATGNPNCPYNASAGTCPSSCINQFNYVKIRTDCGDPADGSRDLFVYYLHVDRLAAGIGPGVHVNAGDLIAYVGNSGCSSGPHVHIETVPTARGANAVLNTCASVDPASRFCP
jgi:hypothetical protein